MNAFIKEGLRQNPNLKFVLTGDFNDFEFSDSVRTIVGNELVNLMAEHEQGDRYSYFYRGSNQSLDNILISKNIKDKVVFSPVHINASFMEEHGRASDHDPVVVQIDFSKPTAPESPKVKPTPEDKPSRENERENTPSQNLGEVSTDANSDASKSNTKAVTSAKNVLPKTGLDTSSSLVFAGISAMMAFFLGRKKRN